MDPKVKQIEDKIDRMKKANIDPTYLIKELERLKMPPKEIVEISNDQKVIIGGDMTIAEAKKKVKDNQALIWSCNSNMFVGYRHNNKFTYSQLLTRTENY